MSSHHYDCLLFCFTVYYTVFSLSRGSFRASTKKIRLPSALKVLHAIHKSIDDTMIGTRFGLSVGLLALTSVVSANLYINKDFIVSFHEVIEFETQVTNSDSVWMIQFFSSDDPKSQNIVQDYSQVAEIARGIYRIGAVDVNTDAGRELAKNYNIKTSSLPSIWLFSDDAKPKKYTGKKTAQDMLNEIIQTGMETIRVRAGSGPQRSSSSNGPSKVVQLTSSNFQQEVLDNPLVSAVACK